MVDRTGPQGTSSSASSQSDSQSAFSHAPFNEQASVRGPGVSLSTSSVHGNVVSQRNNARVPHPPVAELGTSMHSQMRPQGPSAGSAPYHRNHSLPQYASSRAVQGQQRPAWDVPNPLTGGMPQGAPRPVVEPRRAGGAQPDRSVPLGTHNSATQRPQTHPNASVHFAAQQGSAGALRQSTPPFAESGHQYAGASTSKKGKVVLSKEAKSALAKAIWSAIRSPDGSVDPSLMQAALATGLPRNAILNAALVARDREALKRKSLQQQQKTQLPHSRQVLEHPPRIHHGQILQQIPLQSASMIARHGSTNTPLSRPGAPADVRNTVPNSASRQQSIPKPQAPIQPTMSLIASKKTQERNKWRRVHQGIFLIQKGKFMTPGHTLNGVGRCPSVEPVLGVRRKQLVGRKRPRLDTIEIAFGLQHALRKDAETKVVALLDADKYKRIKIEAKKHAKSLDRIVKKSRQAAVEALNKQQKEMAKSLVSHQQEFFKFHRQKRADALKIAKLIRDNFDKESKKKEKDAVAAERARLAALKANDMDAYSKLLEETKNERLKFLMDKTERHFSQISTSLLQERNKDGSVAATGGTASYYASAHLQTEEVRQPSILVGGDLKEYQMSGLQWLVSLYNNKLNGILADEMGLGKTIQAISLVSYLMEFKSNLGPFLVIVPLSTLSNWTNEFQKWCPSAHVICYKGTPGQRKELYKDHVKNGHFNVLLTTYEYIIKDKASLRKITWQYAIVDEGHRMKNAASKFAKTLSSQYTTKYRLLLTGTPLMNDLSELWSLLNFLLPAIFNSVDTFDQWFNRPFAQFGNNTDDESNFLSNEERMFIIHRLHELLRPFMLRRVKSEVLDQLPEKVEKVLRCELSSWQKELYKQISQKAVAENSGGVMSSQPASRGLNNVVMQLRKVCNHPYLFSHQGYHIDENIIRSSGKFDLLDRMLPKLRAAGHRVLMFTQMTAVMTILEDYFAFRGYSSLRLDGSTPAEEREKRMYKFNAPDSPYFIFLLSTRAGGLGLNLTAANTVIIFDSDWNPMMDLQAQDRAHRIGQRSDVSVFRLVTYSPVEEKILSRATEKLNMSELVVEAGKFDKRSVENDNSLERKRVMEVLLTDFGSTAAKATSEDRATSEVTGSDAGDFDNDSDENASDTSNEEDLNDLLSNNENDYQLYKRMDRDRRNQDRGIDSGLFTDENDIPDWVRYPTGRKSTATKQPDITMGNGARKRKQVVYDDGLTEKQFLRLMDKQFEADAAAREQSKLSSKALPSEGSKPIRMQNTQPESDLTDWTFRKLISCTKSVIALKDPSTKRRLSEVFLEKPSPEQFPDYYELIQKPIAINDILRKCRAKLYSTVQEYRDDWKLMFTNARNFNGEDSWVVKDGIALQEELERILKKNGFAEEAPKKPILQKPKKKLRIKLSLKSLKAKGASELN